MPTNPSSPEKATAAPAANRVTLRNRLEYFGLALAVKTISLLPYEFLPPMARALGTLVYLCDPRGRSVARSNLGSVFGAELSESRVREITRKSYQIFGRTMLELFWSSNFNSRSVARIGTIEGLDAPFHRDPDQPVIYLCLHSSNFEYLSQVLAFSVGPGMVVTQQLKNPLLGPIFDRLRCSTGHSVLPQERSMIRMFRHLKKGGYFCMLVDLNLDPDEPSVIVDQFDGLKTCVTQMHAALAQRTGAKIVPSECRINADGSYRMIYHPPLEYPADASAAEIAQICWNVLEPSIKQQPEAWLWSYKHWRYKPAVDDARYPAYANKAKRFDKLIARQLAEA